MSVFVIIDKHLFSTADKKVAIKIVESIKQNIEEIEQEYVTLKKLGVSSNLPEFFGIFLKKVGQENDHQIWFVIEVSKNIRFLIF